MGLGRRSSDTVRAAKAAVTRATAQDAQATVRGTELQPADGQVHLTRREIRNQHTCDSSCGTQCEGNMRI